MKDKRLIRYEVDEKDCKPERCRYQGGSKRSEIVLAGTSMYYVVNIACNVLEFLYSGVSWLIYIGVTAMAE